MDGTGASISFSAEDIGGGTLVPRKKIVWGADGTATDVNTGANALPIQDGGNSITIDGSLTNISGTISLPTGASTLGEQQTQTTSLQLLDDVIIADNAAFTDGTTKLAMAGYIFDDVAGTALTENDAAAARVDSKRAQMFVIEDATTRGRKATVSAGGALLTDASATTQPVSGTVAATQSGTWNIATVTTLTSITNVVHVDDNSGSLTVDNAGTFAVQATIAAGATAIAKAEDVASADADVGVPAMAVRKAAPANTSGTDGDYEFLQMSAGRLWTSATIDAALPTGANVIGAVTQSGTWTVVGGKTNNNAAPGATNLGTLPALANAAAPSWTEGNQVALSVDLGGALRVSGGGGGTQYTEDAASAADPVGNQLISRRRDALSGTEVSADGDVIAVNSTGKGELYVKHVDTIPATQSGTWNIGTVTTVTTLSTITNVVHVDDNAGSLTVDNGGTFAVQATIAAGATAIAKAEDVASADADVGVPAMAVRKAAPANTSGTDGDYEFLQMSAGRLWVDPSGVTLTVASHAVTNAGTFVVQENGAALTSLQLLDDVIVADNAAFTDGTTKLAMAGYIFDDVAGTALTENDAAAGRINANRAMVFALEDGATRARYATVTAANALKVDASGVAVPVTDNAGSLTVDAPVGTPVFVRLSDGAAAITNLSTKELRSATGTQTSVNAATSSATILASNANRLQARIHNHSDEVLYLRYAATATTTNFSERVDPHSTIDVPEFYTGIIDGLWDAATGAAKVTEFT